MKKSIKISALVLSFIFLFGTVTAFAGSNFSYDEKYLEEVTANWGNIQNDNTNICLSPGSKNGDMNFAWLSSLKDSKPEFKFSKNADMSDAISVKVSHDVTIIGKLANRVSLTALDEGTYYYSYTENGVWSEAEKFEIKSADNFTALFLSDSQIGRSGDADSEEVLIRDTAGWCHTLDTALSTVPETSFILSAGDQVELGYSLKEYKAFLAPEQLRNMPVAAAIGNHDFYFPLYSYYFNNTNQVRENLPSPAGHGYYFTYGDALFIVLNSNDMSAIDANKVVSTACRANPFAKWRVVLMHHSPYSAELEKNEFTLPRLSFCPVFDTWGIDLVLSGHDHAYSRTKTLTGGSYADENGTVYIQASSSSGSNFDRLSKDVVDTETTEFFLEDTVATYTSLTFEKDEISVKTYRTDTNEEIDEVSVFDNTRECEHKFTSWLNFYVKTVMSFFD